MHNDVEPTADSARPPDTVDDSVFRVLMEVSADGLAVLDRHGHFVLLNTAATELLGLPADELVGRAAPFDIDDVSPHGSRQDRHHTTWPAPDGRRRDLEYCLAPVAGGAHAVWFSDVTDTLRQQERLTAIARAASSVADAYSLRTTLDAVAREIAMTANIAAVQILAMDDPRDELRVLGMAGFDDAADFTERLSACRRRGAKVSFMDAFQNGEPVVVPHRKAAILADPAWAPLHAIMSYPSWDSFVSMPLIVRGRVLGVINAYYVPDEDPGPHSLAFLEAMADHAAVAIDTASLLAQTRSQAQLDERRRLARDLHDSVVQQLLSMRMQAKALHAQLERVDTDPGRIRSGAEELAELSGSALADLRGLVFELRPLDLAERGLVEAVRAHAASQQARTGLAIDVRASSDLELDSSIDVQEDLYRIVQEALHNVVKHAHATAVKIRFTRSEDGDLVVEVLDNGYGPDRTSDTAGEADHDTLGLVSMRERTQRWGGRLVAGARPAGGWAVRVILPCPSVPGAGEGEADGR
ncbi:PAS domain S-box-containing protein [Halopolyspora algeriensis]|uniref:PAS domain S-box-containing protein n=1 Tax=Halopolyspora algeriensis TaxID=1500506 RepID=A0A368VP83_9ACTN|nr:PAS domain S-box-containing protein [Halopolyspora algeriensis]TQM53966.1 PAS domain S-box-containing protein [Halopolyspora algeriensis]